MCQEQGGLRVFPVFYRGERDEVASGTIGQIQLPVVSPAVCLVHEVMRRGRGAGSDCRYEETEAQQQQQHMRKSWWCVSYPRHGLPLMDSIFSHEQSFRANLKPALNKLPNFQSRSVSFPLDCNGFLWHTEARPKPLLCFSASLKNVPSTHTNLGLVVCRCSSVCGRNQAHTDDDSGVNSPSIRRAFLFVKGFRVLLKKIAQEFAQSSWGGFSWVGNEFIHLDVTKDLYIEWLQNTFKMFIENPSQMIFNKLSQDRRNWGFGVSLLFILGIAVAPREPYCARCGTNIQQRWSLPMWAYSLQLSLCIVLLGVEQAFILLTCFSRFSWALLGQCGQTCKLEFLLTPAENRLNRRQVSELNNSPFLKLIFHML